jgi:hypothetical protein
MTILLALSGVNEEVQRSERLGGLELAERGVHPRAICMVIKTKELRKKECARL